MKVLLDLIDPALRALWQGVLDDHAHVVVNHEPVDLVILELTPGSQGALDSCRRIRQSTAGRRPGILVLVHPDRAVEMVAALKAGADGVLVGLPDRRAAVAHLSALERRQNAGSKPTPAISRPSSTTLRPAMTPAAQSISAGCSHACVTRPA